MKKVSIHSVPIHLVCIWLLVLEQLKQLKSSFSGDLNLAVLNPHTVHNISF